MRLTANKTIAATTDYAAADVVSNSESAGTAWTWTIPAGLRNGSYVITHAEINWSVDALAVSFELDIFRAAPTTSTLNDNATRKVDADDRANHHGVIKFETPSDRGEVAVAEAWPYLPIEYDDLVAGVIHGILSTLSAFTNESAGMTCYIGLDIEPTQR